MGENKDSMIFSFEVKVGVEVKGQGQIWISHEVWDGWIFLYSMHQTALTIQIK